MLLRPLPGELADRQSIVELKINHANVEFDEDQSTPFTSSKTSMGMARVVVNKGAIDVTPFLDELDLIRTAITKNFTPILQNDPAFVSEYDKVYAELAEINSQLWDLEDSIRALHSAPESIQRGTDWLNRVADTSKSIVNGNNKRAELVKAINKMWGYTRQEKMY